LNIFEYSNAAFHLWGLDDLRSKLDSFGLGSRLWMLIIFTICTMPCLDAVLTGINTVAFELLVPASKT
jgi:hypothetical protein